MNAEPVAAGGMEGSQQIAALQQARAQQATTVASLDAALNLQESVLKMLLESLGVGTQLDETG